MPKKSVSKEEAAEQLNALLHRAIEAHGLRAFILRDIDQWEVQEHRDYAFLHKPSGIYLTCVGFWTETVRVQFDDREGPVVAEVKWSSGNGAAEAHLISRAVAFADTMNLALSQWFSKNEVKEA